MVQLTCQHCGNQFQRTAGEVNRSRKARSGPYCSMACRNKALSTGKPWTAAQREKLMTRIPWNKGKPWPETMKQKLSRLASNGSRREEKNGHWRGGRSVNSMGYVEIRVNGKRKLEHRHVMEQLLGRPLRRNELVHHINDDKTDNRPENLALMTASQHMKHHNPQGPQRRVRIVPCRLCGVMTETTYTGDLARIVCSSPICQRAKALAYEQRYRTKAHPPQPYLPIPCDFCGSIMQRRPRKNTRFHICKTPACRVAYNRLLAQEKAAQRAAS